MFEGRVSCKTESKDIKYEFDFKYVYILFFSSIFANNESRHPVKMNFFSAPVSDECVVQKRFVTCQDRHHSIEMKSLEKSDAYVTYSRGKPQKPRRWKSMLIHQGWFTALYTQQLLDSQSFEFEICIVCR